MDPLSITVSCVTLISTIARASYSLTSLIREWRDASGDLKTVVQELVVIQTIIENLMNHTMSPKECSVPPSLQHQISGILKSCNQAVGDIEASITKHTKSRFGKSGYWTFSGGREDIAKHRSTLEAHKSALGIALHMVLIHVTGDIKNDTTSILAEIKTLRRRLVPSYHSPPTRRLKKHLDDMTCYTESLHHSSDDDAGTQYSVSSCESIPDYVPTTQKTHLPPLLHSPKLHRSNLPTLTPYITFTPVPFPTPFPSLSPLQQTTHFLPSHTNVLRIGRASLTRHRGPHFLGLDSKVVSRIHAEIWCTGAQWYMRDLKSTGGTWVNGARLSEAGRTSMACVLRAGDVVQVGVDCRVQEEEGCVLRCVRVVVSMGWGKGLG